MKENNQTLSKAISLIRHGETDFNKAIASAGSKEEIEKIKTKDIYIDCSLSLEGINQGCKLNNEIKNMKIKYVFCSPLERCLETCSLALKDHFNIKDIKVFVHPLISEGINSCQDLPNSISTKKKKYNSTNNSELQIQFDWSLFEELYPINEDFYFLDFIDYQNKNNNIKTELKENKIEYIDYIIKQGNRPESILNLFKRNLKFKQFLKDFILINKITFEEILVFTHSGMIRMLTSNLMDADVLLNYPEDCYKARNCEIVTINV